jgi:hypothetical protein
LDEITAADHGSPVDQASSEGIREGPGMKTLQEISDRMEIEELFIKYAYAIDERNFDELDDVFLPEAVIDGSSVGSAKGDYQVMKPWLKQALAMFPGYQHIPVATKIEIKGDEAFTKTVCFNPIVSKDAGGWDTEVFFVGLWYVDHLIRTTKGWRISSRREERSWFFNFENKLKPLPPLPGES